MRLLCYAVVILPMLASAQPFSQSDPVFSQICSPLLQGCVGAWRLEEANGTRYDLSGKNNNLTSNNSVGQVAGKVGNAARFLTNSTQFLSCPSNAGLQAGASDFTVAFWVRLITKDVTQGFVCKDDNNGVNTREFQIFYLTGTDRFGIATCQTNTSSSFYTVNASNFGAASTNVWYFVLAGRVQASTFISVNNGLTNAIASPVNPPASTATLYIGGLGITPVSLANADIDEVQMWKRALTPAEKSYLYFAGLGTHTPWAHP